MQHEHNCIVSNWTHDYHNTIIECTNIAKVLKIHIHNLELGYHCTIVKCEEYCCGVWIINGDWMHCDCTVFICIIRLWSTVSVLYGKCKVDSCPAKRQFDFWPSTILLIVPWLSSWPRMKIGVHNILECHPFAHSASCSVCFSLGRYKQWNGLLEWNTGLDYWTELLSFLDKFLCYF